MRVDLHIHTSMSDGNFSPSQVIRMAGAGGLTVVAVTDHNTIAGLLEARRAAREGDITLIPAVELTSNESEMGEMHILGYGFDPTNAALVETFEHVRELKRRQIFGICEKLRNSGFKIDYEDVARTGEGTYVGRQHVARAMLSKRNTLSRYAIFRDYLGRSGKAYVTMGDYPPEQAIAAISEAGGITSLAHPTIEQVDRYVKRLVDAGLDAIEVYRPQSEGTEMLYLEMVAEDFGLMISGGSDWHGFPNDPPLGSFYVKENIAAPLLESLGV